MSFRRAFTLIEIICVMAIICVLAALLMPVFLASKQAAYKATALSEMRQLGIASTMYQGEWDDRLVPSTNYGAGEDKPERIWHSQLYPYAKERRVFKAAGTEGRFVFDWSERGWASIGLNSSTAIDLMYGCLERQVDLSGCQAFQSAAVLEKSEAPGKVALFTVTPWGDAEMNYRGYEFSPYNGIPRSNLHQPEWPPMASDKDLVAEMFVVPGDYLKPVYCFYSSDGLGNGVTPIVFADSHVKTYSANGIAKGGNGIIWRIRD